MHQTLHAIKTGFISIIVNNNDKYIFSWISVWAICILNTHLTGWAIFALYSLLLIFGGWEGCFVVPDVELANWAQQIILAVPWAAAPVQSAP